MFLAFYTDIESSRVEQQQQQQQQQHKKKKLQRLQLHPTYMANKLTERLLNLRRTCSPAHLLDRQRGLLKLLGGRRRGSARRPFRRRRSRARRGTAQKRLRLQLVDKLSKTLAF